MKCPRCMNNDPAYFQEVNGRYYCRKCIQFGRLYVDEPLDYPPVKMANSYVLYRLRFQLVPSQLKVSHELVERYLEGKNSTILAVCGGGKTEMLYNLIARVLNNHESVLILIPRRALVVELGERISQSFNIQPSLLYGGHIGSLDAPLTISTIHQSYRLAPRDVVIVDEVDAYPLRGNELLENMIVRVTKKIRVTMSATIENRNDLLYLKRRYHNVDLDVPVVRIGNEWIQFCYLFYYIYKFKKEGHPLLVYVPTFKILNHLPPIPGIRSKKVSSVTMNIDTILNQLKKKELDVLFCTIVLERGITVEDVQVVVFQASHHVYNKATLIQIAGRVGRSASHPTGKVVFLSSVYSHNIRDCIQAIELFNQ